MCIFHFDRCMNVDDHTSYVTFMLYMLLLYEHMNVMFNSLLAQLVKYDVHTTRKIKFIRAIFYHVLLLYFAVVCMT